jgi:hypothetical protein
MMELEHVVAQRVSFIFFAKSIKIINHQKIHREVGKDWYFITSTIFFSSCFDVKFYLDMSFH